MKNKTLNEKLWNLTHEEVTARKLVNILNIRIVDSLESKNKSATKILNQVSNTISKFIFIKNHIEETMNRHEILIYDENIEYFPLQDQIDEIQLELIHSVLAARVGLTAQAIHALRRCLENIVYGSFVSISYIETKNREKFNPFLEIALDDIWHELINQQSLSIKRVKEKIKENKVNFEEISKKFSKFFLENYCTGYCNKHKQMIPKNFQKIKSKKGVLKCNCGQNSKIIQINTIPSFRLMALILQRNFQKRKIDHEFDIHKLYGELSSYLHANPRGHQHDPSFKIEELQVWKKLVENTLNHALWLYVKSVEYNKYPITKMMRFTQIHSYKIEKMRLKKLEEEFCFN